MQCSGNGRIVAPGTFLSSCDCFWGWEGSDCGLPFAEPRSPKTAILYMAYGDEKYVASLWQLCAGCITHA